MRIQRKSHTRIVHSALIIAFLLSFAPTTVLALTGDINDDGVIGLEEAIHALKIVAGFENELQWHQALADTPFVGRVKFSVTQIGGSIFLIGGFDSQSQTQNDLNDVWASSDGVTWNLMVEHAPFAGRYGHTAVALNGKIYVIAGRNNTGTYFNDVWSSIDGVNWDNETDNAGFNERFGHTALVFQSKIWLTGGRYCSQDCTPYNDVWSTTDGITWTLETANAAFPRRYQHAAVVHNDKMWVIAGTGGGGSWGGYYNDVWSSTDGVLWDEVLEDADFPDGDVYGAIVYRDQIFVLGDPASGIDVWSSRDGVQWSPGPNNPDIYGRSEPILFDDKIWIISRAVGTSNSVIYYLSYEY